MKKTVLVTGGAGGIGSDICLAFAKDNYNVIINYNKSKEQAEKLCSHIKSQGKDCAVFRADVTDQKQVCEMFDFAKKTYGGIDVLVNNAGISHISPLNDVTPEDWQKIFDVNVKSAFLCSKCAISHMLVEHSGRIINISSMWGICGASCEVAYSASKASLIGFTKALAKELAPSGITVNCICPGIIDTKMNEHITKEALEDFIRDIPIMRMGKPEEIAHACVFLASDLSGYITGQTISVDGGMT